ncbi:unnamed protein product [Medioppia subpectinata]|uniref:Uncharacterized protein n=1 Tax=Medioppia subpectinata TaxID=1979941 RepID=A0A7R9KJM3_9ACAR|nr:unnamed protein product [Medioppia subpectinata]CAG2103532.1 unnamed protein product [Medioppia subpectinata]
MSTSAKSLTEHVLNRMTSTEQTYYSANSMDYTTSASPSSPTPPQQIYVKEREMYEYREYNSSPTPYKSSHSPTHQKPPPVATGRPFTPEAALMSPTAHISYHQPEEQQWLSSQDSRPHDPRVFALSPQPPPSPSPVANQSGGKDTRVFGMTRPKGQSPSASPTQPPTNGISTSATPSPVQDINQHKQMPPIVSPPPIPPHRIPAGPPVQDLKQLSFDEIQRQSQRPSDQSSSPQDKQFYAQNQNKKADTFKHHGIDRPVIGRVVNDQRVFAQNSALKLQRLGSSGGQTPHWKTPLPQMNVGRPEVTQLLPSQTRRQQTYIVQTPPTERNARPPPTGTLRRRIRPVWPPPEWTGRHIPKTGFASSGRDSPTTRYDWPPSRSGSVDPDGGTCSPRMRFSTPPPGPLQHSWNPRSGSVTPPGSRSYTPTRRVQNTAWPPPSNATPAGVVGMRVVAQSLPGSRRGSGQADDYYVYAISTRIPQTYRPPPQTQYTEPTYHYDTD